VRPPSSLRLLSGILLLLVLGAGLALVSHAIVGQTKADDSNDDESIANPPTRVTMKNGMVILTLSTTDVQNAGIECAALKPPPADQIVAGFATVIDPTPLYDLNGQYIDAEAQVTSANAKFVISQAALQRAQILYKDDQNVSAAQLQSAQTSFNEDQSAVTIARSRLSGVVGSARQAWGNTLGTALVDHSPLIDDLIARRDYLVKVTLPPGVVVAAPPQTAVATLYSSISIALRYISIATSADPKLQGTTYFYETAARDELLPGLNLDVALNAHAAQRGSVVPNSAVIWLEGQAWIYIRADAKTFIRRQISPNRSASDDGYIVTDLQPGAQVVVHGTQMLLSEEFRAQVPVED
jgi:hypothetical protein